jgi:hypothetical protein
MRPPPAVTTAPLTNARGSTHSAWPYAAAVVVYADGGDYSYSDQDQSRKPQRVDHRFACMRLRGAAVVYGIVIRALHRISLVVEILRR